VIQSFPIRPLGAGMRASPKTPPASWLLLIHQIPPRPGYLRVKIWRRLQRLGAVSLKNSVYLLPDGEQGREDFEWIRREIKAGGGDASICGARFIEGLTDAQGAALFLAARNADYAALVDEAKRLRRRLGGKRGDAATATVGAATLAAAAAADRLRRRLADIAAIDFFDAPGRQRADRAIAELEREVEARTRPAPSSRRTWSRPEVRGRTWVTRQDVHVDRMASAWLIRRFIDAKARFRFVPSRGYRPGRGEIRFDMFEAEFTHDGDLCTFEVLLRDFGFRDRALERIAAVVHDIDLKDAKFGPPDAPGIARLMAGIVRAHANDATRLERSGAVFDALYAAGRAGV
jgi:hypothetical protein